uniref:Anaphase-promoting complex subunit 11 n=1 Tax=Globodera rostochiensis TaxID=31243 RepID=A0A914HIX8_GLORO
MALLPATTPRPIGKFPKGLIKGSLPILASSALYFGVDTLANALEDDDPPSDHSVLITVLICLGGLALLILLKLLTILINYRSRPEATPPDPSLELGDLRAAVSDSILNHLKISAVPSDDPPPSPSQPLTPSLVRSTGTEMEIDNPADPPHHTEPEWAHTLESSLPPDRNPLASSPPGTQPASASIYSSFSSCSSPPTPNSASSTPSAAHPDLEPTPNFVVTLNELPGPPVSHTPPHPRVRGPSPAPTCPTTPAQPIEVIMGVTGRAAPRNSAHPPFNPRPAQRPGRLRHVRRSAPTSRGRFGASGHAPRAYVHGRWPRWRNGPAPPAPERPIPLNSIRFDTPPPNLPVVLGQCKHPFHMHCIVKWTNTQSGQKPACPLCRQEWKFATN